MLSSASNRLSAPCFRSLVPDAVKCVGNVDDYDRRIQSALKIQGRKMERRAEYLLTRSLRKAGWK